VWPQSRLGIAVDYQDDFASRATDIHNLKPCDPGENSSRSNDYFNTIVGNDFYEPRDEVKGDIARILFYMSTMYAILTLDDDETTPTSHYTMGTLSILLEWNLSDPVDEFELNAQKFNINDCDTSFNGGSIKHNDTTIDDTHTHPQDADSAGNAQQNTGTPL
jgi:endonuclease I